MQYIPHQLGKHIMHELAGHSTRNQEDRMGAVAAAGCITFARHCNTLAILQSTKSTIHLLYRRTLTIQLNLHAQLQRWRSVRYRFMHERMQVGQAPPVVSTFSASATFTPLASNPLSASLMDVALAIVRCGVLDYSSDWGMQRAEAPLTKYTQPAFVQSDRTDGD